MTTTNKTIYKILFSISLVHLLNDSLQSVVPAILPFLRSELHFSLFQAGVILLVLNVTASVFQPVVGMITDKRPIPLLLPIGLASSGVGMVGLATADSYWIVLVSVMMVGFGSATFHPEASRVAFMAAGSRRGLAQSIFQVGGNTGQAFAPLISILVFVPFGQPGALWFTIPALLAVVVLYIVALWYRNQVSFWQGKKRAAQMLGYQYQRKVAMLLLVILITFRSWVHTGIQGFYHFFLIDVKNFSITHAQIFVFIFLLAGAIGTFFGGPLADRFGKRNIFLLSFVGAIPFTLALPYIEGWPAYIILFLDGFILLSSFSVSVVYAQELMPGRIGLVSGLIIGLAFGMGGIGASLFGWLADRQGLFFVMTLVSCLPIIGLLGFLLPKDEKVSVWNQEPQPSNPAGQGLDT